MDPRVRGDDVEFDTVDQFKGLVPFDCTLAHTKRKPASFGVRSGQPRERRQTTPGGLLSDKGDLPRTAAVSRLQADNVHTGRQFGTIQNDIVPAAP